jgi:hypothetical protein
LPCLRHSQQYSQLPGQHHRAQVSEHAAFNTDSVLCSGWCGHHTVHFGLLGSAGEPGLSLWQAEPAQLQHSVALYMCTLPLDVAH